MIVACDEDGAEMLRRSKSKLRILACVCFNYHRPLLQRIHLSVKDNSCRKQSVKQAITVASAAAAAAAADVAAAADAAAVGASTDSGPFSFLRLSSIAKTLLFPSDQFLPSLCCAYQQTL